MTELFSPDDFLLLAVVCFTSIFVFMFNYRHDNTTIGAINKDDKGGHEFRLVFLDLCINIGMAFTGFLLVTLVFSSVPQLGPYQGFKYPVAFLFSLTANVSIPIVLKWFADQLSKKIIKLK